MNNVGIRFYADSFFYKALCFEQTEPAQYKNTTLSLFVQSALFFIRSSKNAPTTQGENIICL